LRSPSERARRAGNPLSIGAIDFGIIIDGTVVSDGKHLS
jgi:hypothetical protein